MLQLIKAKSCRNCKHSMPTGNGVNGKQGLECRRYPPQVGMIPVPHGPGQIQITVHAAFPPVDENLYCEEHKPRIDQVTDVPMSPIANAA